MLGLLTLIKAPILQNSKRLRTFSRPMEKEILPIDPRLFQEALLLTLIRFQTAFQKMGSLNPAIWVTLSGLDRLEVGDQSGRMVLQGEVDSSTLFYQSPLSGTYKYCWDEKEKRFYSNKDGHLLEENISREAHRYFGDVLEL